MPQLPFEYDHDTLAAQCITRSILAYLDAHGYEAWSQPNRRTAKLTGASTRDPYGANTNRWRPHPNSPRGVPDILGFRRADGLFLGVEVKAGRDRLRDEQITFLNQLKAAGGLPFVAHSFAGFVQSFERRGLHLSTVNNTSALPYPTELPGPTATYEEPAPYHP
ncbi:VRR-NUC domain-containing protein [Hymenobacter aerophilus]|uniref:VRR-NUC domain-containing protein n=1 Tax=Hymenobacter aerophilus TaxID=119644 RepID=UPI000376236C|nr:VRR-NUC domain-containing protein [Hymenobacter aerophilus]